MTCFHCTPFKNSIFGPDLFSISVPVMTHLYESTYYPVIEPEPDKKNMQLSTCFGNHILNDIILRQYRNYIMAVLFVIASVELKS